MLEALADEVSAVGSLDFSIGDVAERAGVSPRTVYNYFPSRQGLVDAFADWSDRVIREQGGAIVPTSLDDLGETIVINFGIFEDNAGLAEVLARIGISEPTTAAQERRTAAFVDAVADGHPELDEEQQRIIAALLRQLASVRTWYSMTREQGLTSQQAAQACAWAIEQLDSALARGERPPPAHTD